MDSITDLSVSEDPQSCSQSLDLSRDNFSLKKEIVCSSEPLAYDLHDQIYLDLDGIDSDDFGELEPIFQVDTQSPPLFSLPEEFDLEFNLDKNLFEQKNVPGELKLWLSVSEMEDEEQKPQHEESIVLGKRHNFLSPLNLRTSLQSQTLPSIDTYFDLENAHSIHFNRYRTEIWNCVHEIRVSRGLKNQSLSTYEEHILLTILANCDSIADFDDFPGLNALSQHLSKRTHRLETMKKKVLVNCLSFLNDEQRNLINPYFPKFSQSGKQTLGLENSLKSNSPIFKTLNKKFRRYVMETGHADMFTEAIRQLRCSYAELFVKEYQLFVHNLRSQHSFLSEKANYLDETCDSMLLRLLKPRTLEAKIRRSKIDPLKKSISKEFGVKIPWSISEFDYACRIVSRFISGLD